LKMFCACAQLTFPAHIVSTAAGWRRLRSDCAGYISALNCHRIA
jgi:hypothetical protein